MNATIYIGTYTAPILFGDGTMLPAKGKGIYKCEFDCKTGKFLKIEVAAQVENPSFLAVSSDKRILYAVNETKTFNGAQTGAVSAFCVEQETGNLTLINQMPTGGTDPCHILLDRDCGLYVSNYSSGSLSFFALREDGGMKEQLQHLQNRGHSVHPQRQAGPHVHSTLLSVNGKYLLEMDLGADEISSYTIEKCQKRKRLIERKKYQAKPGSGPRMAAFNSCGTRLYVVNELSSTVSVFAFSVDTGELARLQTVSTLPDEDKDTENLAADVRISADERFLYVSNRGGDNISCFRIHDDGRLSLCGVFDCGGACPRCMAFDASGSYLLCANQDGDCVSAFRVDKETGALCWIESLAVPNPACIIFG